MKKCVTIYIDDEVDRQFQKKLSDLRVAFGKKYYKSRVIESLMSIFNATNIHDDDFYQTPKKDAYEDEYEKNR